MSMQPNLIGSIGVLEMLGGMTFEEFAVVRPYFKSHGFPSPIDGIGTYDRAEIEAWRDTYGVVLDRNGAAVEAEKAARIPHFTLDPDLTERLRASLQRPKLNAESPPGFVYVVGFNAYVKIGYTRNLATRLPALQTGAPHPLTTYLVIPGSSQDEAALHERFSDYRTHGEWFDRSPAIETWIRGCEQGRRCPP